MKAMIQDNIVRLCIEGDEQAQYRFYQQYAKAMFNICIRMLNDFDLAEDALQDAFISAFKNLPTFKGDAPVGAWLKRIVVNTCLNYLKKRSIEIVNVENIGKIPVYEEEPTDYTEIDFEIEKVKQGIRQLPSGFRVVLSLYLIEGYDHKEIAEILNISESTSKSQYNRAKKKLRDILKK